EAAVVVGTAPSRRPEVGSYDDYCVRQREYTSALTLDSPQVRAWIDFAVDNGGTLPYFKLPLGDLSATGLGCLVTVPVMGEQQTERFESVCISAGAPPPAGPCRPAAPPRRV